MQIIYKNINEIKVYKNNPRHQSEKPYREIVNFARRYINILGGFEKLAKWGLF